MITSTKNDQVRHVQNLIKKSRARREEGLYVAEGLRICRELDPEQTEALYVTEAFLEGAGKEKETACWLEKFDYEIVGGTVMSAMADTQTPQGILAVARQKAYTLKETLSGKEQPFLMVLEAIQDPGNLGTIIRAGEGAGITGVIMDRGTADIYNPKVIRSTMGSIFRVPFLYTDDLRKTCRQLKSEKIRLFAAHLQGRRAYDQEDYTGPCGFLIGNEAKGLSEETAGLADAYIKIPMKGKVESLNAAVAASVLMFETARQRRKI